MDCSSSAIYRYKIRAVIILLLIFCTSGDVDSDKHVLLEVKHLLTDPFGLLSAWNDDIEFCRWPGITCSSDSRVTAVRIPRANKSVYVAGQFPRAILQLDQLRFLSLRFNRLRGLIPDGVWRMEKLEVLDLQGNFLTGSLPATFTGVPSLRVLDLGYNNLHGEVPASLSNCSFLEILNLSFNQFTGRLPPEIGNRCRELVHLDLSGNLLVGAIPSSFGNLTHLRSLVLHSNLFSETIPTNLGFLKHLQVLDVSKNSLSGPIPLQLGNCSNLSILVLSSMFVSSPRIGNFSGEEDYNYFQGGISMEIWSLPKLRLLWAPRASLEGKLSSISASGECESLEMINLGQNFFTGEIPNWFSRCRRLHFLDLSSNMLTGELNPELRVPCMRFFDISNNLLTGGIPKFLPTVCNSNNMNSYKSKNYPSYYITHFSHLDGMLVIHNFSRNNFHGGIDSLPISSAETVSYMFIAGRNKINTSFSTNFFQKCNGLYAVYIDLSNNLISDQIPETIDALCRSLRKLDVSANQISGFITSNLSRLVYLVSLNLSWNNLEGQIPESLGEMKDLKVLALSGNNLNGSIPAKLGQIKTLEVLELSSNSLSGEIPSEISNLANLTAFLVDNNKLSGRIPNFRTLEMFNASFNNLSGPLPSAVKCTSLLGNPLLCRSEKTIASAGVSGDVSRNNNSNNSSPPVSSGLNSIEIASVASSSAIVAVLIALVGVLLYTRKWKPLRMTVRSRKKEVILFTDIGVGLTFEKVVEATGSFSASNCIGNGGFGATYKAEVSITPAILVAVKRLAIGRFQGVQQFHAEIKTLGRLRHPNLVTLIGYHASETEMFLVYNYLPGGNLEKFIHERSARPLEWRVLHKISLDIARALAYLHDQCVPRVVHRDVKPSNILLDNEFNAYLSDFGLARLLESSETHATTGVAGTFGYVAPEYAMTCRVSDKADVYSYGVVLMELFSDKKALDPSFSSYGNGFNIVAWASLLLRHGRPMEFFTPALWSQGVHDDLVEMLQLAVLCTVDSLPARPAMKQVVRRLKQLQPPT